MMGPLVILAGIAELWSPIPIVTPRMTAKDADLYALELLVTVLLFVVAAVILFVAWFASRVKRRPVVRRF